jgi:hypothetical protein
MTTTVKDETVKVFVQMFDGKRANWRIFKAKFESYLPQKDMSLLLAWDKVTQKDDETWTETELKNKAHKDKPRIMEQNKKAVGLLLGCIKAKTHLGEAAFDMVHKFMDSDAGYAGGNFKKTWALMARGYEDKDITSMATLKQDCHKFKMEEHEVPSLFIVKMERMR